MTFEEKMEKYLELGRKVLIIVVSGAVILTIVGFVGYSVFKIFFGG